MGDKGRDEYLFSIGTSGNKVKNRSLAIIEKNRFSTLVVNKVSQDEEQQYQRLF